MKLKLFLIRTIMVLVSITIIGLLLALLFDDIKTAQATAISLSDPAVFAVGADLHISDNKWSSQPWNSLEEFAKAAKAMGAKGSFMLGDIFGAVSSANCGTTSNSWDPAHPMPCPADGAVFTTQLNNSVSLYGFDSTRFWVLAGNHDGHPVDDSAVAPYNKPWGFWKQYINPLGKSGLATGDYGTMDHYEVQTIVASGGNSQIFSFLMVSDRNDESDRANGGRCGGALSPTRCATTGMPAAEIGQDQLEWMKFRIQKAIDNNRKVIIMTHEPPPNSTVGSWEGKSTAQVCPGVTLHGSHNVALPPERPDLSSPASWDTQGRTPVQVADAWGGAIAYSAEHGIGPAPTWASDLITWSASRATLAGKPQPIIAWMAGHSHVKVPDLTYNGHTTVATVNGVKVIQTGALGYYHCNVSGACLPMAGKLTLHATGPNYAEYERWDLNSRNVGAGTCTTTSLPALVKPGAFRNVPIINLP